MIRWHKKPRFWNILNAICFERHKFNVDLEIGKYTVDEKYLNMSQAFNSQVLKLAEFCLVKVSRFQLPRQTRACPNVMIALVVNMQRKALMMVAGGETET